MAASIAVVYPHMNAIGGDGFWLIRDAQGPSCERSRPAASQASTRRSRAIATLGYDASRPAGRRRRSPSPARSAAGRSRSNSPPRSAENCRSTILLERGERLAREGVPVSPSETRSQPRDGRALVAAPSFASTFFLDGKPAEAGAIAQAAEPRRHARPARARRARRFLPRRRRARDRRGPRAHRLAGHPRRPQGLRGALARAAVAQARRRRRSTTRRRRRRGSPR